MMNKKKLILYIIFLLHMPTHTQNTDVAAQIGNLIWQNECSKRKDRLVFWNQHEPFPSLGIGHFIWYPEGQKKEYSEQFPTLCNYLKEKKVMLPMWLNSAITKGAPWHTRDAFLKDTVRTNELKELLTQTIPLQAQFIIDQFNTEWPKILSAVPRKHKKAVQRKYELLTATPHGMYAVIDYTNFKGTGLNPKERSNGKGWGLMQVLMLMPDNLTQKNAPQSFALTAAQLLTERMQNDGPEYKLARFLHGWMKRLSTYY